MSPISAMDTNHPSSSSSSSAGLPAPSAASSFSSSNEQFVILANGTKGAAAVGLIQQVLEAPHVLVFGELLDHPNIQALQQSGSGSADGEKYFRLLNLFAFGVYSQYVQDAANLPPLTPAMRKKLRLLTVASMATKSRLIKYSQLQTELQIESVRELEDLIIEGTSANVVQGKLDQKSLHFEVDYTMARDLKKSDVTTIISTLEDWCRGCDGMLDCLELQAERANKAKAANTEHKSNVEKRVEFIRSQIKATQQSSSEGADDPDSRMDMDSSRASERRDKKSAKGKIVRGGGGGGVGGGGGSKGFWPK